MRDRVSSSRHSSSCCGRDRLQADLPTPAIFVAEWLVGVERWWPVIEWFSSSDLAGAGDALRARSMRLAPDQLGGLALGRRPRRTGRSLLQPLAGAWAAARALGFEPAGRADRRLGIRSRPLRGSCGCGTRGNGSTLRAFAEISISVVEGPGIPVHQLVRIIARESPSVAKPACVASRPSGD